MHPISGSGRYSFKRTLDTLPVAVLAIDEEGRVEAANEEALRLLGKDMSQVEGRLRGEVMECQYSHLAEGCGNTIHVHGCQIQSIVGSTRSTSMPVVRKKTYLSIQSPEGLKTLEYHVSTEKLPNGTVLLRIDDVSLPPHRKFMLSQYLIPNITGGAEQPGAGTVSSGTPSCPCSIDKFLPYLPNYKIQETKLWTCGSSAFPKD